MASEDTVNKVFAILEDAYRIEQPDNTVKVYFQTLMDLPDEILLAAAKMHIAENKWFPSVAELRTCAARLKMAQYPTAIEAWGQVRRALMRGGIDSLDNPIAVRVARGMGWNYLGFSTNEMADRAHFIKAYEQVALREEKESVMLPEISALAKRLGMGEESTYEPTIVGVIPARKEK